MNRAESEAFRPDVLGWATDILPWIREVVPGLPAAPKIVEVGVYHGRSLLFWAEELARAGKLTSELWGVDTWQWKANDWPTALENVLKANRFERHLVRLVRAPSVRAARMFDDGELDMAFIDGDHDECDLDIEAWLPKVRLPSAELPGGGIIAGHDYGDASWPKVAPAVDNLFASGIVENCAVVGTVWSANVRLQGLVGDGRVYASNMRLR